MTPHEAAQSVAWFAVVVLFGVAVVIYLDIRKESRNEKQSAKSDQLAYWLVVALMIYLTIHLIIFIWR